MNSIISIIFSSTHSAFQSSIYQYLKVNSIVDAVHLLIITPSSLVFSRQYRDYYLIQLYFKYAILYVSKALNTASSLINIKIAVDRYIYLKKKRVPLLALTKNAEFGSKNKINIIIFFIFAFTYSIPNLIFYEVKKKNSTYNTIDNFTVISIYKTELCDFVKNSKHRYLKILLHALQFLITFSNLFIMIIISTLTYRMIHKKYENFVKDSIELRKNLNTSSTYRTSDGDIEEYGSEFKNLSTKSNCEVGNKKLKRIGEKTSMLVLWVSFFFYCK